MHAPRLMAFAGLLLALALPLFAQEGTGLRPPTPEEAAWDAANLIPVEHVTLNAIGEARLQQAVDAGLVRPAVRGGGPIVGAPPAVDNSTLKFFPPVRSQGSIGSCASFAATYYASTYMLALARDWDAKAGGDQYRLSPKWTYNMINGGTDSGAWITGAYNVSQRHGTATWAQFPYNSNYREWSLDPAVWRGAINYRMGDSGTVGQVDTDTGLGNLKTMLANGYILNYATYINSWQFTTVKDDPTTTADDAQVGKKACHRLDGSSGEHAMTVVGYNDDLWIDVNGNGALDAGEKGAVRVVNSWGTGWGNGGFCWLSYDALKPISAVSGAPTAGRVAAWWGNTAYWIEARASYAPTLLGEFTINSLKRGRMVVLPGVSTTSVTTPAKIGYPGAINYSGGDYGFGGVTTAVDGTFVFDYTDLVNQVPGGSRWYASMKGGVADAPATITRFKLTRLSDNATAEWTGFEQTTGGTKDIYVDLIYSEPQPDLAVMPQGGAYVGDNTYNATGDTQSALGFLVAGTPATFLVKLENDWTTADTLRLRGPGDAASWTVRYFDAPTGGADISNAITGSGWDVTLAAAAMREIRVEITGDASLAAGDTRTLLVSAESTLLAARNDAVRITATMGSQPDMLVKTAAAVNFAGDGTYNATGTSQSAHATAVIPATAVFLVELQNEWANPDTFTLTGPVGSAGWTVRYFDDPVAGADITADVTGAGFPAALVAGAARQFRVEVTPDATVAGAALPVLVQATSQASGTIDAVLANTYAQPAFKIDLEISQDAGVSFIGANTYSTDGSTEIAARTVAGGSTATYPMRFHDAAVGAIRQTYVAVTSLKSFPAGWSVRFFDGKGGDITSNMAGSGWMTFASAALTSLRVEVTPDSTVPAGTQLVVPITLNSMGEGSGGLSYTVIDVVQAVTTCSGGPQPDVILITPSGTPEGDNVYDDGTTQAMAAITAVNSAALYRLKLQNDWAQADVLRITASAVGAGWTVRYYDDVNNDITAAVNSGWDVALGGGEAVAFRAEVTPDGTVPVNATQLVTVTATSQSANSKLDTARLTTTNGGSRQPDVEIAPAVGALIGSGIYNTTGVGQTVSQTGAAGVPLVYRLRVTNRATFEDAITIAGADGTAGWTVRYFDAHIGGNDITADMLGVGWTLPMAPLAAYEYRMEITPDAALSGGAVVIVPTAGGAGTPPTVDAAYATATVASSHGLDALVREVSGSDIGAGVRNLDAAGQTVSIATTAGATVVYVATIRNESNLPEQVRVTRPAVPAGWTLQAFDAASGGANITGALATGWTKIVARGGVLTVRLEVTAAAALGGGAQCPLLLTAEIVGEGLRDAVKTVTTVATIRRPDLLIRPASEIAGLGDGVYNTTGSDQTAAQPSGRAKQAVIYVATLQNDGNAADGIRLTGTTGGGGWTVRYFDAITGGTEITTAITAGTYTITGMAANATRHVRIEVTPDLTVAVSAVQEFALTARSTDLATATDVVKGRTMRQAVPMVDLVLRDTANSATLIGNSIHSPDGAGQSLAIATRYGVKAVYRLVVQNDGEAPDTLVVRGEAAGPGWRARYFDSPTGGFEITNLVTGADGWVLASRSPSSYREIRVEVTANSNATFTTSTTVHVSAASAAAPDRRDTAELTTTWPALSAVSLAVTPGSLTQFGTALTLTATATGGNVVDYQFRYGFRDPVLGTQWTTIRTFLPGATVSWTPSKAGMYSLIVYATERGSANKYGTYKIVAHEVRVTPLVDLTITPSAATPGAAVTLTAVPATPQPYEYLYRVATVSGATLTWTTVRGFRTDAQFVWRPAVAGAYYVEVQARIAGTQTILAVRRLAYAVEP